MAPDTIECWKASA